MQNAERKTQKIACLLALLCLPAAARADDSENLNQADHQWAVLIGCENYARAAKLRYTVNDVRQIADTLHVYGGYGRDQILELTDDASNERHKPLKSNLEAELPQLFKKLGDKDVLLVYFSGHGFRDAEGKMYLAPLDVDPENAAATGVAVEWLREQIAACPAACKLLVLDACHAGSEKGDDDSGVAARELGEPFKNLDRVVTLASSAANEKSQIWEEKEQSLFSFWLNQGLKGHADADGDGAVDIDELYKYVSRAVTRTAAVANFSHPQTPVRIVRSGIRAVPAVLQLQPQRLRTVLADMAELLADTLAERRAGRVGVLEFINDTRLGELLGADFGQLGKWCAAEFERRLGAAAAGRFNLLDGRRLQEALSQERFALTDLASSASLRKLSTRAGGMPVLALGTLKARSGDVIHLRCKLLQTEGEETLAEVGGMARITESEWAMFGHSGVVRPSAEPPARRTSIAARQASRRVIRQLDQAAAGAHPLASGAAPFNVKVMVGGRERRGKLSGNDYTVGLRPSEVYVIDIENRTGKLAAMRLLVDGLNTLPEKTKDKGVAILEVAPRVNLDEARHYVLDPKKGRVQSVRGFVTETGVKGEYRDFKVVDAERSLAARKRFTDQVGLITVAFYEPGPAAAADHRDGRLGTDLGEEHTADLTERSDVTVGNLICVINIHYAPAK